MTHLLDTFYPHTWNRQPPGMTFDDWVPWKLYLLTPEASTRTFAYDIELRIDQAPAHITDPKLRDMWARNNARRVDAVGKLANGVALYEARRRAGWSAIAQLQGYRQLWPFFFPDALVIERVLVVESIADEIRASASLAGLRVWKIGE